MSWQDRTEPKNCISDLWRGRGKEDSTFFLQRWIADRFINLVQCRMYPYLHFKKRFTSFPSPAGMSITKLPLGRNNSVMTSLFPPRESLVVTSRLGTGNSRTLFYGVPWDVFTCDANKVDRQPTSACANCVYAIGESVLAVSMLAESVLVVFMLAEYVLAVFMLAESGLVVFMLAEYVPESVLAVFMLAESVY